MELKFVSDFLSIETFFICALSTQWDFCWPVAPLLLRSFCRKTSLDVVKKSSKKLVKFMAQDSQVLSTREFHLFRTHLYFTLAIELLISAEASKKLLRLKSRVDPLRMRVICWLPLLCFFLSNLQNQIWRLFKGRRASIGKAHWTSRRKTPHSSQVSDMKNEEQIPLSLSVYSSWLSFSGLFSTVFSNAGIEGVKTPLPKDSKNLSAKEISEMHLNNESPSDWAKVFEINTSSLFFASMAMLPLLEAGNKSPPKSKTGRTGWSGAIINITSISGVVKMAQDVRTKNEREIFSRSRIFQLDDCWQYNVFLAFLLSNVIPFSIMLTTLQKE